jgi:hypothetical protein
MELFKVLSKTFVLHVPYRGTGPAINDTVTGVVPMLFDNLPSSLPSIRDCRLVPIVVVAPTRLAVLPNVPTFAEMGMEPVNRMAFYGFVGPKNMTREVVYLIHGATRTIVQDAGVRKRIEDTGSVVRGNTPAEFAAQIAPSSRCSAAWCASRSSRWSDGRGERWRMASAAGHQPPNLVAAAADDGKADGDAGHWRARGHGWARLELGPDGRCSAARPLCPIVNQRCGTPALLSK